MPKIRERIVEYRPPRIAMFLIVVAGLIYGLFPAVRMSLWKNLWCGFAVFFTGFAFMIWAWVEFQKRHNPICPTATPVALIRCGPFRFSRNPMYFGMLLMLVSPLIAFGSPLFLFPPLMFFAVINFAFIPWEEKMLEHSFREAFANYRCSVRRWI
jgi:protein-S-isoprenylcysteine O-methyltransferase Ste14